MSNPFLTSPLLQEVPGALHGFGTIAHPIPYAEKWKALKPVWKQVHGIGYDWVTRPGQDLGEIDAMITRSPGMALAVVTADCVPILLLKRDGSQAAAIHAGWRGSLARITPTVWAALKAKGEVGSDWVAAIGPSIGPCCYEVDPELAERFRGQFGDKILP
ncbi:MAG: polyphenol oxidase family protein, partial [Bdellovibrionota bacterium]